MKCRTAMISDTHLGTRGCQDVKLLHFLKRLDCEELFLVGDIIDGWALKRSFFWNETHNAILKEIIKKSRHGTRIVWVIGNHDEFVRSHLEHVKNLGGIELTNETVHVMNGKRYLVVHGDEYDGIVKYHRRLAVVGDIGYGALLWTTRQLSRVGLSWSPSRYAKSKVKAAAGFITGFEKSLVREAKLRGCDGVVCGHIHTADSRMIDGIHYLNCGDWVESCTAVIERNDGIEVWK